ncbi:MAG: glycosyltransferase family 4 protein [Terriglobales bacterium]
MSTRLVILTEIIAPYRIPVFNALAHHQGIDLHVLFLAETDPGLRQWPVYKDEIDFSYEVLPSHRLRLGRHSILLNRGVKSSLRNAAPDIIVCGGYNYFASWQTKLWAKRRQVPFVLWVESTDRDARGHNFLVEWLKAKFMRDCRGFIVPGKSSLEYVKNYLAAGQDVFIAPNAIDVDFFSRQAAALQKDAVAYRETLQLPARFFLFTGRLVLEKGVFDLLDAYAKLAAELRAEIGLVFVGEGPARADLARRATRIVPGHIQFAGFAHREALAAYYSLADVFVFPSHSDPWGLVVNESMVCGLPVIATDAAGCTADLVEDNWNGRVVRSRDVGQLASAMEELARGSTLRHLMGSRSREHILRYSPQACAAGIAGAALSLTAGRQKPQSGSQSNVLSDHALQERHG